FRSAGRDPSRLPLGTLVRKYGLPVRLHVHHDPSPGWCLVKSAVQSSDRRLPVIGVLSFPVGMVHDQAEPGSTAGRDIAEHFIIAVRVAARRNRSAADELVDS